MASLQQQLDELNKCKCCDRHQLNRPTIIGQYEETKGGVPENRKLGDDDCKCDCRHRARMLCRYYMHEMQRAVISLEEGNYDTDYMNFCINKDGKNITHYDKLDGALEGFRKRLTSDKFTKQLLLCVYDSIKDTETELFRVVGMDDIGDDKWDGHISDALGILTVVVKSRMRVLLSE